MLKLRLTTSFKKDYKLIVKRGYDISLFEEVLSILISGQKLPEKYRDHILMGHKYKGLHECHIQNDWLLIYRIFDQELILELCYTGTHSDLF